MQWYLRQVNVMRKAYSCFSMTKPNRSNTWFWQIWCVQTAESWPQTQGASAPDLTKAQIADWKSNPNSHDSKSSGKQRGTNGSPATHQCNAQMSTYLVQVYSRLSCFFSLTEGSVLLIKRQYQKYEDFWLQNERLTFEKCMNAARKCLACEYKSRKTTLPVAERKV